jgi:hypothetical protein
LLAVGLIQWARQRVPASILVLGASTAEQLAVQAAIRDAVLPFRPVSLLQTGELEIDVKIAGDCFRIDDEDDWQKAVFAFCRTLPVLTLDLRRVTRFVELEMEHVLTSRYLHKTLFIAAPEDEHRLTAAERRLSAQGAATPVLCVRDTDAAIGFLQYLLFELERVPGLAQGSSIVDLSHQWRAWRDGETAAPASGATSTVHVTGAQLAPFSYSPPAGWEMTVAEAAQQYAVLFRPPEESGVRNILKRRSRLDLSVFGYTEQTVPDEATLRRGTEFNLKQRGASITRERMGQRCGAISHECFYQRGISLGYLVRFIIDGNEYVVHWMSMNGRTMERHQPEVDRFVDSIGLSGGAPEVLPSQRS